MAKYLLLKHYRGAPAPANDVPMDRWTPEEVDAHIGFMHDFANEVLRVLTGKEQSSQERFAELLADREDLSLLRRHVSRSDERLGGPVDQQRLREASRIGLVD